MGTMSPTLCNQCGFFHDPQSYHEQGCKQGPTVYRPYSRGLADVITKAALSPQLLKDPSGGPAML